MSAQPQPTPPPPRPGRRVPGFDNFAVLWTGAALIWKKRTRAGRLPDRPQLAPGVKLVGQMEESAFKNPPWMVERGDGTFVQVTPLLFKVAEQSNGANTVEDIAAQITEAGTPVQAQTVGRAIGRMLIPQGIILTADGEVVKLRKHAVSPLTLSMRMKMLSPELIRPLTGVLQYLFWPPLLIAILLAAGAAQWWVFFQHGIAGPIHDALYRPASMLVLLAIVVASAAFHEFGHAAGLRYGGGKVRGMGVGLYLIYPVVYTDVTDEYRLGRWARVRTDLGGFYFNLIFALGILGIYLIVGQPFLLVSVLLTDLEIFQQLMPFTRLDGYWILADLTGIPDFFSNLAPFVRSELHLSGPHVQPLKTWARVVFAAYLLITGPLLVFLVFMMVKNVPRVIATAWSSFGQQVHNFIGAESSGNGLGMVLAVVAVIGLGIPTVGLFLVLYRLGKQGSQALWAWSAGSLRRRAVASAATAGIVVGIIFLWLPQIPFTQTRGPLYSPAALRPIGSHERGTIHDAVPAIPGPQSNNAPAPSKRTNGTSRPTPKPTPPAKATSQPRAIGGATRTPTATGTPLPGRTPAPTRAAGAARNTRRATATPLSTPSPMPTPTPNMPASPTPTTAAAATPTPVPPATPTPTLAPATQ